MKSKDLQSNFTTIEQSKQLIELGLTADSADCVYEVKQVGTKMIMSSIPDIIPNTMKLTWNDKRIPCWSVGRLIQIYCLATGVEYTKIGISEISLTELMIKLIEVAVKLKTFDFSKLELD